MAGYGWGSGSLKTCGCGWLWMLLCQQPFVCFHALVTRVMGGLVDGSHSHKSEEQSLAVGSPALLFV